MLSWPGSSVRPAGVCRCCAVRRSRAAGELALDSRPRRSPPRARVVPTLVALLLAALVAVGTFGRLNEAAGEPKDAALVVATPAHAYLLSSAVAAAQWAAGAGLARLILGTKQSSVADIALLGFALGLPVAAVLAVLALLLPYGPAVGVVGAAAVLAAIVELAALAGRSDALCQGGHRHHALCYWIWLLDIGLHWHMLRLTTSSGYLPATWFITRPASSRCRCSWTSISIGVLSTNCLACISTGCSRRRRAALDKFRRRSALYVFVHGGRGRGVIRAGARHDASFIHPGDRDFRRPQLRRAGAVHACARHHRCQYRYPSGPLRAFR